jgi:hypothetical protein
MLAVEGVRPFEVVATAIAAGDTVPPAPPAAAVLPGASPPTAGPAPSTQGLGRGRPISGAPAERAWRRVDGRVVGLVGKALTLRDRDGRTVTVDVTQLGGNALAALRPGEEVTVFAVGDRDDQLVAVGFVHVEPAAGSALPRR